MRSVVTKMRSRAPSRPYFSSSSCRKRKKGDGGLRGGAGLGHHVDRKVLVLHVVQQLRHGVGREGVSREEDLGERRQVRL